MAKQTIVIETAKELSLNGGMIAISDRDTDEVIFRALEDVQMIMIDHHSACLTTPLIAKLAKNNICIVYCDETHMPVSMTMDFIVSKEDTQRKYCLASLKWLNSFNLKLFW